MAGTIPLSLAQQVDTNGKPLAACLLYIYQVGTVATPQNAFQDFGLTLPLPNPVPGDQAGRIPFMYLADGQVHIRLTDALGVVVFDYPSVQVVGPSSGGGGGGGGSVDPTTIASTGDFKFRPTSETLTGWVKANGTTIGSATSGAGQRANADTQNLFVYLWQNFSNAHCPVAGGRGVSALADFSANTTIQLPDWRGGGPVGLDDMGAAAAGWFTGVPFGAGDNATTPSGVCGENNHTVQLTEMPSHKHAALILDPGHLHQINDYGSGAAPYGSGYGSLSNLVGTENTSSVNTGVLVTDAAGNHNTTDSAGGTAAMNVMQRSNLVTFFIKL